MKSKLLSIICLAALFSFEGCSMSVECSSGDIAKCSGGKSDCIKVCKDGFFEELGLVCKSSSIYAVSEDSHTEMVINDCDYGCSNNHECNSAPVEGLCGKEICRDDQICNDGKCIDACGGEICKADMMCINHKCRKECGNNGCKETEDCRDNYCVDLCDDKHCKDESKICFRGKCVDSCNGKLCLSDEVCVGGKCVDNTAPVDPCETFTCDNSNEVCRDGECTDLCDDISCTESNEICKLGKCIDVCEGITCNDDTKCVNGRCVGICFNVDCDKGMACVGGKCVKLAVEDEEDDKDDKDDNFNHMFDRYETAPKQGQTCRKYSDCNSEEGLDDGFCDSFLNYTCSTKCKSDAQCVDDTYYCRNDGRCAPKACESLWKIATDQETLKLPIHTKYEYDITVDWGDGTEHLVAKSMDGQALEHLYEKAGNYHVKIYENDRDIGFYWSMSEKDGVYDGKDATPAKLIKILSYGPVGFARDAFRDAKNLSSLPTVDIPDATRIRDRVFCFAHEFNLDVENWDVSRVVNFQAFFDEADIFNKPLNKWDVSNGNNMKNMFHGARAFNKDINEWDVSGVVNMEGMFYAANRFNKDISSWNTSNLKNMGGIFQCASNFNQNINSWDVSHVTGFEKAFEGAKDFNQSLPDWDIRRGKNFANIFGPGDSTCGIDQTHYCETINGPYADKWHSITNTGVSYNCQ